MSFDNIVLGGWEGDVRIGDLGIDSNLFCISNRFHTSPSYHAPCPYFCDSCTDSYVVQLEFRSGSVFEVTYLIDVEQYFQDGPPYTVSPSVGSALR